MNKRKQPNFKTANWTGVVRPRLADESELITLTVRLPKELAEDVELATSEYRHLFNTEEELIATAIFYAISSLAEELPTRKPIRSHER